MTPQQKNVLQDNTFVMFYKLKKEVNKSLL